MEDYNLDYINKKVKQNLDTGNVTYGMNITNNDTPTRLSGNCKHLLYYVITDLLKFKRTYISYTPLRTTQGKMRDHFATSVITGIKMHKPPNVTPNKIDKTNYRV